MKKKIMIYPTEIPSLSKTKCGKCISIVHLTTKGYTVGILLISPQGWQYAYFNKIRLWSYKMNLNTRPISLECRPTEVFKSRLRLYTMTRA